MLYGQKHKDPLSLIMHDVEKETYGSGEVREEESIMGNKELIRSSLEELCTMLGQSEEYAAKVVVSRKTNFRTESRQASGKLVWRYIPVWARCATSTNVK